MTMNNNTNTNTASASVSVFASALLHNLTIKDKKVARINGGLVGVENFAEWNNVLESAHNSFYSYDKAIRDSAKGLTVSVKAEKEAALADYKKLVELIGEVNGFTIAASIENLNIVARYATADVEKVTGEALVAKQELSDVNKRVRDIKNGMSAEYIENLLKEQTAKKARFKDLCKKSGSAEKDKDSAKFDNFAYAVERELGEIIEKQAQKSYAEIAAERAAQKEANKAKARAKAQALREAKKAAEAEKSATANA